MPTVSGHATYVACGLKYPAIQQALGGTLSCHVCGMWIEIITLSSVVSCKPVMPRMWHVD